MDKALYTAILLLAILLLLALVLVEKIMVANEAITISPNGTIIFSGP